MNDVLDKLCIEALAALKVKYILCHSEGFNHTDVTAAKNVGIKVARVPAYSPSSIAEHAMVLILTLNRKTHKAY